MAVRGVKERTTHQGGRMKIKGLTLKDGKAVFSRVRYHEMDRDRSAAAAAAAAKRRLLLWRRSYSMATASGAEHSELHRNFEV